MEAEQTLLTGGVAPGEILLLATDGARYRDALRAHLHHIAGAFDHGLVVSANRPHGSLSEQAGPGASRFRFVDCVSALTGMAPPSDRRVQYVESPTLLEKISLRAEIMVQRMPGTRAVLVDSLSTLAVYNDVRTVAEWAHHLINRMRMLEAAVVLVFVERQAPRDLRDLVEPLCDRTLQT